MAWALVTGAASGIGRALADEAARGGYDLVISGRLEARLTEVAEEIAAAHGVRVAIEVADLAEPFAGEALWRAAVKASGGRIDVLVNNAGLGRHGAFGSDEDGAALEAESLAVNIVAVTALMDQAVRAMRADGAGGRILNVASTAAFMPGPNMAVYHASKAYVLSLSEAVRAEVRGSGIVVTALCPGATRTAFFDRAGISGGAKTRLMAMVPMPDAQSVAAAGWSGMMAGRARVIPGILNKVFAFLPRISPRGMVAWLAGIFLTRMD